MSTPNVSFEFFPPQSLDASFRLWDTVAALAPLDPNFVSVTYGAGGTTRDLTHDAVGVIHNHYGLNVAAHLTCVEASKAETLEIADQYARAGVKRIVALRGDPVKGQDRFKPRPDGFANSIELIEGLAETGRFDITVGAYPDPHPEAQYAGADVDWLKRKVDAGATSAITQFFFEAETYFRFRDACDAAGIDIPIVPGILPIHSWAKVRAFAKRSGTAIPAWLDDAFDKAVRDDREELLSIALASEMTNSLLEAGVEDLHFYTLNTPHLTRTVCNALGIAPKSEWRNVA